MLFSLFLQTTDNFLGIVSNLQSVNKSIFLESQRMRQTSNRYLSIDLKSLRNFHILHVFVNILVIFQQVHGQFKKIVAAI